MSKHEDSIREGAQGLLAPGEEILAALIVSPRGSNTAVVGGLAAGEIGARWSRKNSGGAEDVGLAIKRNCSLALTGRRLLTLDVAIGLTGAVKDVKELLGELPIERVDAMKSRWNALTISAGETDFKLECKPPAAKAMVRAFDAAKAAA